MPNIKFNYFYRDSANYKKFGNVIFPNPDNIQIEELEILIKSKLIDETYFYTEQWNLPELFLNTCDFRNDPKWHEFEDIEFTDRQPLTLNNLIAFIKQTPLH